MAGDAASPAAAQAAAVQALTEAFRVRTARAWAAIAAAEQAVLDRWARLGRRARRTALAGLQRTVTVQTEAVNADAAALRATLLQVGRRGASSAALAAGYRSPTIGVPPALQALAADTYGDVLAATRHVDQTTKVLIRSLARDHLADKIATGQTVEDAGAALARELAEQRITAVVYGNGAHVPLDAYTDMLARTKTAEAYQVGGFAQIEDLGIQYVEVFDGPGCGWSRHDDPLRANGRIITLDEARVYPISHPNCRRSTSPRPDVTDPARAVPVGPQHTPEQIAAAARETSSVAAVRAAARRGRSGALVTGGLTMAQQRQAARVARAVARSAS